MEKLRVEMEKCNEYISETHWIFMALKSGEEEKKNGWIFLSGNFEAASNREVFEEIRKTTAVVGSCLTAVHNLPLQRAQTLGLAKSRGDQLCTPGIPLGQQSSAFQPGPASRARQGKGGTEGLRSDLLTSLGWAGLGWTLAQEHPSVSRFLVFFSPEI